LLAVGDGSLVRVSLGRGLVGLGSGLGVTAVRLGVGRGLLGVGLGVVAFTGGGV